MSDMQVKIKDAGPCRKTLKIELPADRVKEEYERVLAAYTEQARIPGFRTGKAPQKVVERRFGKEIAEEVKDRLIPDSYRQAIAQEELDVVAILGVENVSFDPAQPLRFDVMLDVPPEFKLPKHKGIRLKGQKVAVTDDDVGTALESIRSQYASFEDVEDRGVQKGDLVQVDYEGFCDGKAIEEILPKADALGKGVDFWFRADDNTFLPGLSDGLLGEKIGDKKQVFVDFASDFAEPVLAGRKATYFVDVKAIREERLPDMDQEFLEKLKVASEEDLRSKVRDDLMEVGKQREEGRLKNDVIQYLLKECAFELPGSLVDYETRNAIYDTVREHTARGVRQEEIEEKKQEIFESAARNATDRIKLRYILHRIAEKESIEVRSGEVDEHIQMMAGRYGMDVARLRAEMEERKALDKLHEDLRMHKTLDFLVREANVKM